MSDEQHAASILFMKRRYESEDLSARPLPLIEIDGQGFVSVKQILDKYMASRQPAVAQSVADLSQSASFLYSQQQQQQFPRVNYSRPNMSFSNNNNSNFNASGGKRGNDARDLRVSSGTHLLPDGGAISQQQQVEPQRVFVPPKSEFSRKISSYLDVDAPKVWAGNNQCCC